MAPSSSTIQVELRSARGHLAFAAELLPHGVLAALVRRPCSGERRSSSAAAGLLRQGLSSTGVTHLLGALEVDLRAPADPQLVAAEPRFQLLGRVFEGRSEPALDAFLQQAFTALFAREQARALAANLPHAVALTRQRPELAELREALLRVRRHLQLQAEPHARTVSLAFSAETGNRRGVYALLVESERDGRLAALAADCPGLLLLLSLLRHRRPAAALGLIARVLDGAPLDEVLDAALTYALGGAEGSAPWTPSWQRTWVACAGPHVPAGLLLQPRLCPMAPEEVPLEPVANRRWYERQAADPRRVGPRVLRWRRPDDVVQR